MKMRHFPRVGEQKDKSGGNGAKERPKDRNDVGNAHNDADEHGVGHVEKRQADAADNADNQGIQKFAGDKPAENPIDGPQVLKITSQVLRFRHKANNIFFPCPTNWSRLISR